MKILQFCYKPPYPTVDGGTIGMNSITEGLINNECEVKVITFYSTKNPFNKSLLPQSYISKTNIEAVFVDLRTNIFDALLYVLIGRSYVVERFISSKMKSLLIKTLKREQFDIIQLESIMLAPYISLIRKYSKAKITFHCPNVEHLIWKRIYKNTKSNIIKRLYLKNTYLNLKFYELNHINDFDAVFPTTDIDEKYFKDNGCKCLCKGIPIGFDYTEELPDVLVEENTVFHIGSMNWFPNEQGIRWFLNEVWEEIHKTTPQIKAFFAGRKMPNWLLNGKWEGVNIVGEVDDSIRFMSSKQIMVVPLLSGSGIRIKILEAMSIGKVVVATSIAAEGIMCENMKNIIIANTPQEFALAIKELTTNKELLNTISKNAYELIRTKYNINSVAKELISYYNQLLEK